MAKHAVSVDRYEVDEAQPLLANTNTSTSTSTSTNARASSCNSHAKLRYMDAFALLVSIQIGSGVFSSPSQVDRHTASPGYALIIWVISGLIAWAGAACYAELGAALPINGGMLEYVKHIFGDSLAFMASWIWIFAVKPSAVAILSITFAQYWVSILFGPEMPANGWESKTIAISGMVMVVFFNMISIDATTKMTKFFFFVKVLTLLLLIFCTFLFVCFGVHQGGGSPNTDWLRRNWFTPTNESWHPGIWNNLGEGILAIYAGLWAFSGWDNANMVAGDMQNSTRDLPRAIHTAQPFVICAFIIANVCYYVVIPWSKIDINNTIAVTVGYNVLNWPGSVVFAILVSLACLGSVNVNIYTGSRLVVTAAQAEWFPHTLAKYSSLHDHIQIPSRNTKTKQVPLYDTTITPLAADLSASSSSTSTETANAQTPILALLFSTVISAIYIILGTFNFLITLVGLAEYVFFTLTVIGVIVLRVREPQLHRPYKPNLAIAVLFVCCGGILVLGGVVQAPVQAALLGGLVLLGFGRGLFLKGKEKSSGEGEEIGGGGFQKMPEGMVD